MAPSPYTPRRTGRLIFCANATKIYATRQQKKNALLSTCLAQKKGRPDTGRPSLTGRKTVLSASRCIMNKINTGTRGLTMYFQDVRVVFE